MKSTDAFVDPKTFSRERAKPLAPDERRAAIIDAVIPLIRQHGRTITTRQIADAAGIAEGTIFRAFGDKDSIIQAAIDRFMDPEPLRAKLRGIDPDEPTDEKIHQVLHLLRERFTGFIGFMSAVGMQGPPPRRPADDGEWIATIARVFREEELGVSIETFAYYLRLLAFGTSIPLFNTPHEFTTDELVRLVTRGVIPQKGRS